MSQTGSRAGFSDINGATKAGNSSFGLFIALMALHATTVNSDSVCSPRLSVT
jgi:hypothetical protein